MEIILSVNLLKFQKRTNQIFTNAELKLNFRLVHLTWIEIAKRKKKSTKSICRYIQS